LGCATNCDSRNNGAKNTTGGGEFHDRADSCWCGNTDPAPQEVLFQKYSVKHSNFCVLTEGSEEYVKMTKGKQLTWFSRAS
jgi:hypothetical protein